MAIEPYVTNMLNSYQKTLLIALKDTLRFKPMGLQASKILISYFNNVKRDVPSAMDFLQKGLQIDPLDAELLQIKKVLMKVQGTRPNPPKTGNSGNTNKKKVNNLITKPALVKK
jgi:hypothetical protein